MVRIARYSACETAWHMKTASSGSMRSSAGIRYSADSSGWHIAAL